MTASQLAKDFRVVLRHFKALPSFKDKGSPLRKHVLQQFHAGKLERDELEVKRLRGLAYSSATMVRDIKELKYLRHLDSGEKLDPREKIKNTAARVGLGVPKFADEQDYSRGQPFIG